MTVQQSIDYHAEQLRNRCETREEADGEVEEVVSDIIEEHSHLDEHEVAIKLRAALDRLY